MTVPFATRSVGINQSGCGCGPASEPAHRHARCPQVSRIGGARRRSPTARRAPSVRAAALAPANSAYGRNRPAASKISRPATAMITARTVLVGCSSAAAQVVEQDLQPRHRRLAVFLGQSVWAEPGLGEQPDEWGSGAFRVQRRGPPRGRAPRTSVRRWWGDVGFPGQRSFHCGVTGDDRRPRIPSGCIGLGQTESRGSDQCIGSSLSATGCEASSGRGGGDSTRTRGDRAASTKVPPTASATSPATTRIGVGNLRCRVWAGGRARPPSVLRSGERCSAVVPVPALAGRERQGRGLLQVHRGRPGPS